MKKKRRNPRPERSAFESARAALERAGEEYPPAAEEDVPGTPEPSEPLNDPEELETPVSATVDDMEHPEALEDADDAEPEAVEDADSPETEIPVSADAAETQAAASTDSVEAQAAAGTDAVDAQTVGSADAVEAQAAASTDAVEAQAAASTDAVDAQTVGSTDSVEAQAAAGTDSVETQAAAGTDSVETQVAAGTDSVEAQAVGNADAVETQAAAPVQPDTAASVNFSGEIPGASPELSGDPAGTTTDEPEAVEDGDAGSGWDVEYEPFPDAESEVTDTERHTMETKEITLGYKGPDGDEPESGGEESGRKSEKRGKKPRFPEFKPLNRLKAALQDYVGRDKADREEKERDDGPPSGGSGSSGSSRDAAIRKRVMQIEDEETRNYLLDRVLPQMTWYGRKSAQYQKMYYRLMLVTIVLGALIPISSLLNHPVASAILGVSVTAINAYLALRKYHELWVSYRSVREDLLHNLYCYFNRAGVFAKKDSTQEELDVLLVDTCETAFAKENGGWVVTMQKPS